MRDFDSTLLSRGQHSITHRLNGHDEAAALDTFEYDVARGGRQGWQLEPTLYKAAYQAVMIG